MVSWNQLQNKVRALTGRRIGTRYENFETGQTPVDEYAELRSELRKALIILSGDSRIYCQ